MTQTLTQGEPASRRYELRGDDLPRADTYYVVEKLEGQVSGCSMGDDWKPFEYRVQRTLDTKERLPL